MEVLNRFKGPRWLAVLALIPIAGCIVSLVVFTVGEIVGDRLAAVTALALIVGGLWIIWGLIYLAEHRK